MDVVLVIDHREFFDFPAICKPIDHGLCGEYPVGIELNSLGADRSGEIEHAAGRDHAFELFQPHDVPVGVDRVTITAKPEMFDGVEAGQ